MFKLLFLYFLSVFGFICYADTGSYSAVSKWFSAKQGFNNSLYYVVSGRKWKELPEEMKAGFIEIAPSKVKIFLNAYGLNDKDRLGYYVGSIDEMTAYEMSETIKALSDIYQNTGIKEYSDFYKGKHNKLEFPFLINGYVKDFIQTQNSALQNPEKWMIAEKLLNDNLGKRMIETNPEIKIIEALSFYANSIHEQLPIDQIRAHGMQSFLNAGGGVENFYTATNEELKGLMKAILIPQDNSFDYGQKDIGGQALGQEKTKIPSFYRFYKAEPIGGGGGGAVLISMEVQNPAHLAKQIKAQEQWEISEWGEIFWGQAQSAGPFVLVVE